MAFPPPPPTPNFGIGLSGAVFQPGLEGFLFYFQTRHEYRTAGSGVRKSTQVCSAAATAAKTNNHFFNVRNFVGTLVHNKHKSRCNFPYIFFRVVFFLQRQKFWQLSLVWSGLKIDLGSVSLSD